MFWLPVYESKSSISDFTDEQNNLDEKIAAMTERYEPIFPMESRQGLKDRRIPTGFIDSLKPKIRLES